VHPIAASQFHVRQQAVAQLRAADRTTSKGPGGGVSTPGVESTHPWGSLCRDTIGISRTPVDVMVRSPKCDHHIVQVLSVRQGGRGHESLKSQGRPDATIRDVGRGCQCSASASASARPRDSADGGQGRRGGDQSPARLTTGKSFRGAGRRGSRVRAAGLPPRVNCRWS
jgi:hypothetical protein